MHSIPTTIKSQNLVKRRREQLVLAAIELFAKDGYHNTTLKNLSEASGLSYGNIYDYVGKKEDIFFLIHDYIDKIAYENLSLSLKGVEHPLEKIRRLIRAELEVLFEYNDAILLLYQETHILVNNRKYLRDLLQKERRRHAIYEAALKECIESGYFREINGRLVANLIKILCESCVLKRWDLTGYTSRMEMEEHIINLVLEGLLNEKKKDSSKELKESQPWAGRRGLLINGETPLAKAIAAFLISQGVKLSIHVAEETTGGNKANPIIFSDNLRTKNITFYSSKKDSKISVKFFKDIEIETGGFDIIIQDLGTGLTSIHKNKDLVRKKLKANLHYAQSLAFYLEGQKPKPESRSIVYLAPWAWDKRADPITYGVVDSAIRGLTKHLAKQLSTLKIMVNCLIPGYIYGVELLGIKREGNYAEQAKIEETSPVQISDFLKIFSFLVSKDALHLTGQVLEIGDID